METSKILRCCKSRLRKQGLKLFHYCLNIFEGISLQKSSTKTRIETIYSANPHLFSYELQKSSTKTRIETFHSHWYNIQSGISVAKVVYENKDWNVVSGALLIFVLKSCKSRLRKQGLKRYTDISMALIWPKLQKSSTKTRIETYSLWSSVWFVFPKVAKVVYENKDWNSEISSIVLICLRSCKSRLRKQGLKHFWMRYNVCNASRKVAKVVYENKDWNSCSSGQFPLCFSGCKSRLRKQGLKHQTF